MGLSINMHLLYLIYWSRKSHFWSLWSVLDLHRTALCLRFWYDLLFYSPSFLFSSSLHFGSLDKVGGFSPCYHIIHSCSVIPTDIAFAGIAPVRVLTEYLRLILLALFFLRCWLRFSSACPDKSMCSCLRACLGIAQTREWKYGVMSSLLAPSLTASTTTLPCFLSLSAFVSLGSSLSSINWETSTIPYMLYQRSSCLVKSCPELCSVAPSAIANPFSTWPCVIVEAWGIWFVVFWIRRRWRRSWSRSGTGENCCCSRFWGCRLISDGVEVAHDGWPLAVVVVEVGLYTGDNGHGPAPKPNTISEPKFPPFPCTLWVRLEGAPISDGIILILWLCSIQFLYLLLIRIPITAVLQVFSLFCLYPWICYLAIESTLPPMLYTDTSKLWKYSFEGPRRFADLPFRVLVDLVLLVWNRWENSEGEIKIIFPHVLSQDSGLWNWVNYTLILLLLTFWLRLALFCTLCCSQIFLFLRPLLFLRW